MTKTYIADIEVKTGTRKDGKGSYTRYTVRDGNGEFASTFSDKTGQFLQANVGKFVDLETRTGAKGTDVVTAAPWVEQTELAPLVGETGGDRSRSIERQTALKAAVELAIAGKLALPGPSAGIVLDTISVANDFARWLAEDGEQDNDEGPPTFDPDDVP